MIRYTQGNLLEAPVEALVNTVNEVGVMGKGIALMFKEAFPDNTRIYEAACRDKEVQVGRVLVTANPVLFGPRWIINFPTKKHWRHPSQIEWIRSGLLDLARVIRELKIRSVALPPLGCGNGGLQWSLVRREIVAALSDIADVDVVVYEPTDVYQNAPKRSGLEGLTPARALILEMIRQYSALGLDCTHLEVQKLAWFVCRALRHFGLQDPLDLKFGANRFGPYSDRLKHLLDGLDGSYLHCEKRLSDAGPKGLIWLEETKSDALKQYVAGSNLAEFAPAIERVGAIIDGFQSPLGMELLATLDWLMVNEGIEESIEGVRDGLRKWPGGKLAASRKMKLFDDRLISLGLTRLREQAVRLGDGCAD